MKFTDKAKKYLVKRLSQKGYVNNSSRRSVQKSPRTLSEVKRQNRKDQGRPMANSPFSKTVSKQDEAYYKSKYEWLFDPVKGVQWDFNPVQIRELAQDDAWVQMLVNTMTTEIANTPWQIVEDDNAEVTKNLNPFQKVAKNSTGKQAESKEAQAAEKFLKQPNPDEDFTTFIEQLVADYLEIGSMAVPKSFAQSDYDENDTLTSANPTLMAAKPSDPITFTKDYKKKTGIIQGYWQYDENTNQRSRVIGRGGAQRTKPISFKAKEVAWKDLNPRSNRRYGLPPTLAVQDILMLLDLTISQEQDYWSRGAFPSGFIKSNGDINEIDALKDETQGERGRQGGMFHVSDPDAEWVQMANNWKEMEMNEREKWYAKIIASEFQVPMSVVGLKPEEVNRSTFEGERDNFESNTLGPYLQDIERWITQNFIKPHFSNNLRFEWIPGTSENQKKSISDRVNTEFQNNLITRNEAREQLGYAEVDEEGFKDEVVEDQDSTPSNPQELQDQLQLTQYEDKGDNEEDEEDESEAGCDTCDRVGKPFGPWESFDDCVNEMMDEQGYDKETAQQVCGSLQQELKDKDLEKMSDDEVEKLVEKKKQEIINNMEKTCDQCNKDISKSDNKRFCSKKCYNKFLSKEEDEPLRSDEQFFEYDFQPRHVEEFKEELQTPIRNTLKEIFNDDRFNQLVERFAQMEQQDNSTQKNSAELRRVLNELIKDAALTRGIDSVIENQSASIAITALEDQISDTGLSADTDEVEKRIRDRDLGFVQNFSQRMEEEIRDTVATGWQQGQSISEIQENLQNKADDLSDYQAERIARDQLQRSTGEARNAFAEQHSDKFVEVWSAVGDDRTRPAHQEMDGMWKRPGEEFLVPYERANGDVKEKFPGDSPMGIQCRCRTDLVPIDSVSEANHRGE